MRTWAEMNSGSNERFASLKWPMVHKLLDGEMYTISVSQEARVKRWLVGALEDTLNLRKLGLTPTFRNEVIDFGVKETTRVEVRRPNRDGSLNWPW
jgi:hypothetical protein